MSTAHQQATAIYDELRQIVLDTSTVDESELDEDSPLLELVDSLGVAELFAFVEEQIDRPLLAEEMNRENFATIATVVELIGSESAS